MTDIDFPPSFSRSDINSSLLHSIVSPSQAGYFDHLGWNYSPLCNACIT